MVDKEYTLTDEELKFIAKINPELYDMIIRSREYRKIYLRAYNLVYYRDQKRKEEKKDGSI